MTPQFYRAGMIRSVAWYKEWFGAEYLELYSHRDRGEAAAHVAFVMSLFEGTDPKAVLDLACGAGRHTDALRQQGARALGVDLSLTLLAQPPRQPSVAADMCCLPFADRTFDWILNFFTSFGYFETERQNFRVLEEIVRVLNPGGKFLIDLFNREYVLANLVPHDHQKRNEYDVEIERWFDAGTERVNKRMRVAGPGQKVQTFLESVRAYRPEEVEIGMHWAGLEVAERYGSFDGETFNRDSERLIIVGHKPD